MDKFLTWKARGFLPKVIYDIGANEGRWTTEVKSFFPDAAFHLFEAFEENKNKNPHPNYNVVLLGKQDNQVQKFYCTKGRWNTGNSTYIELTHHFSENNYRTLYIPSKKLDTYVKENSIALPDMMKLDVQGGELDVLEGAKECMQNCQMILLEGSLHRYNKGAPLFADVVQYMNENNFEVIDIIDNHIIEGYLAQVDLLFAKKGSGFRREHF